jgi:hypothetical protein
VQIAVQVPEELSPKERELYKRLRAVSGPRSNDQAGRSATNDDRPRRRLAKLRKWIS